LTGDNLAATDVVLVVILGPQKHNSRDGEQARVPFWSLAEPKSGTGWVKPIPQSEI
jgi:hypothetical protein